MEKSVRMTVLTIEPFEMNSLNEFLNIQSAVGYTATINTNINRAHYSVMKVNIGGCSKLWIGQCLKETLVVDRHFEPVTNRLITIFCESSRQELLLVVLKCNS